MRWVRGLARVLGGSLLAVLLIPSLAAWPAAFVDRGADGSPRLSAFPLALVAFDPFVWTCARNSAVVASIVAGGSLVIGVGLGLIAGRWRFWGRAPLWALAIVPMAAGPLLIAPGIALALGGQRGWDWLAFRSILGISAQIPARWAALIWAGLACGVPLVALTTAAGSRRVAPSWSEAARAVGAPRRRAWRDVVWPILRPEAARASAAVFTITLVEPVGPLVFGLKRTLAVQILDAANRLDQPTRAAILALLAIAIAALGRAMIHRWAGPAYVHSEVLDVPPASPAGPRRASASRLILAVWCLLAFGPIGLLLTRAVASRRLASPDPLPILLGGWLSDPDWRTWAANSAVTAGLAVAVDLVILRAIFRRRPGPDGRGVRLAARLFESIPPLALGAGALATPWLLSVVADEVGGPFGGWLRSTALELSPGRSPGFLLVLALAIGQFPMLAGVAKLARGLIRPVRVDSARIMGESDRRALRAGEGRWLGVVPILPAFLAFSLAATNLAPALLLTPSSERRTLAPAVFDFLLEPDPLDPLAVGPIAAIFAVNLLAFALASRSRVGSVGDWSHR